MTTAVAVEVDLLQAATGAHVEVSFEAVERCEHCHGNGAEPGTPIETCERCGGSGQLQAVTRTPFGQMVRRVVCEVCHGDGRVAAAAVPGVPRSRPQGEPAHARGRCAGRDRRRAADQALGARTCRRGWRSRGRSVCAGEGARGRAVRARRRGSDHRAGRARAARGAGRDAASADTGGDRCRSRCRRARSRAR